MSHFFNSDYSSNPLSLIDGRVKLLLAITVIGLILSSKGLVFPIIITVATIVFLLQAMKAPFRFLAKKYAEPLFIVTVLILLKGFFGQKSFSTHGLLEGLSIAMRVLGSVSVVILFNAVSPFHEVLASLSWFKVPKAWIDVAMLTYRYIFVLTDDAQVIYQAQKNRGGYSNLKRSVSSFGTLAGSVVLKALEQADATSTAMVARGYTGEFSQKSLGRFEIKDLLISLAIILFFIFFYFMSEKGVPVKIADFLGL